MRLPAILVALGVLLLGVTLLVVMATRPPDPLDGGEVEGERDGERGEVAPPEPTRLEPPVANPDGSSPPRGEPSDERPRARASGVVLDDRGDPVEGAWVNLLTVLAGGPPILVPPGEKTTTDAAGRFAVSTTIRPPFALRASKDGYEAGTASVRRDGADVEIRMRRLLRILGSVVDDATRETVGKGTLLLRRLRPTGEPEEAGLGFETKEDGRFVLADLAAGRYVLTVSVPGYDGWTSEEILLSRDEPDATLEVRVTRTGPWGTLKVSIQDPTGLPVTGVNRVLLHDPESGFLALTPLGADAPVRLEAPEGRHVLQVMVDGFLPEVRAVNVPAGSEAEVTVTLRAAGHVRIEVLDVAEKPARDYRLGVFDAEGEELEYDLRFTSDFDVEVRQGEFIADPPLQGTLGRNQLIPSGAVELKNLPPGRYRLVASKEGFNPTETTVDIEASATAEVRLTLR